MSESHFDLDTYVTGSSGLLGGSVCGALSLDSPRLEITKEEGWAAALGAVDKVVHCAAIASCRGIDPDLVRGVNFEGTKRIARIAKEVGVNRFVYISSVKVFGESTKFGEFFSDLSPLNPGSVYAESKALAEEALMELHESDRFEVVIIRPTVILSPNAGGAIGAMSKQARRGLPFPVLKRGNRRDFVSIDNLVSAIICALDHPLAGGRAFSVTDGETISTGELFLAMADACDRNGLLIKLPNRFVGEVARRLRVEPLVERVFGNLEVNTAVLGRILGWEPEFSTLEFVSRAFRQCEGD